MELIADIFLGLVIFTLVMWNRENLINLGKGITTWMTKKMKKVINLLR